MSCLEEVYLEPIPRHWASTWTNEKWLICQSNWIKSTRKFSKWLIFREKPIDFHSNQKKKTVERLTENSVNMPVAWTVIVTPARQHIPPIHMCAVSQRYDSLARNASPIRRQHTTHTAQQRPNNQRYLNKIALRSKQYWDNSGTVHIARIHSCVQHYIIVQKREKNIVNSVNLIWFCRQKFQPAK